MINKSDFERIRIIKPNDKIITSFADKIYPSSTNIFLQNELNQKLKELQLLLLSKMATIADEQPAQEESL